jgi:hypothetical protein
MKYSLIFTLLILSIPGFAQYIGGNGDGYDSSEFEISTSVEKILESKNINIFSLNEGVTLENLSPTEIEVIICDIQGKFIKKEDLKLNDNRKVFLDKGIYIFSLIDVSGIETRKIFIL